MSQSSNKLRQKMKLFESKLVSIAVSPEDLMSRVQRDDVAAFRELYERFKGPMLTYIAMQLKFDKSASEDLCQEVFIKVYRARASYIQTARFTTWLWTIARNVCIDHFRRNSKDKILDMGADIENVQDADVSTNAEFLLLERVNRDQLELCFQKLPQTYREALALRIMSELSYEDISKNMNLSLGALKSIIHRAKEMLIGCIQGGIGGK